MLLFLRDNIFQYLFIKANKQTVVVQSSAVINYRIINYEGNNKKIVPDPNSLLNKRRQCNENKRNCSQWIVYTCKISRIEIQPPELGR